VIVNIIRLAGAATLVLIGLSLWMMSRRRARLLGQTTGAAR